MSEIKFVDDALAGMRGGRETVYLSVIADQGGEDLGIICGYMRPNVIALVKAAPALLALARQYASECAECGGTGSRTITTYPGGIEVDADDQLCDACAEIRAVIVSAGVAP